MRVPGLAECLRVLLAPELHLLLVREADALGAMRHGRRLAVREAEVQDSDDDRRERNRDQRSPDEEPDHAFHLTLPL